MSRLRGGDVPLACVAMSATAPIAFAARESKQAIEEGLLFAPKFDEHGLIPAFAVDSETGAPLMLAYMNEQSLKLTLELGEMVYWSRSRSELWHKGKTSGQIQRVVELRTDCDQDALIAKVDQQGSGCCHTGANDCFYRRVAFGEQVAALDDAVVPLERV
jgi:phosphoribosyl-AMP cyclohydrolase